jgi:ribose 5-phosphate isomerase B
MNRRRLISERDVRRAVAESARELDVGDAAVTPAAIDLAHRLGIVLVGLRGEDRLGRRTGKPLNERRAPSTEGVGSGLTTKGAPDSPLPAASAPSAQGPAIRIAIGADHGGVALKDTLVTHLKELGHSVVDHGTNGTAAVDYPDFALAVARSVAASAAEVGIMVDGAGIGSCMVANKVPGVRAAMCYDVTTAANAREHNNANMLTLGGGLIGSRLGLAIVDTFLTTRFGGGRHAKRVEKIDELDEGRRTRNEGR